MPKKKGPPSPTGGPRGPTMHHRRSALMYGHSLHDLTRLLLRLRLPLF